MSSGTWWSTRPRQLCLPLLLYDGVSGSSPRYGRPWVHICQHQTTGHALSRQLSPGSVTPHYLHRKTYSSKSARRPTFINYITQVASDWLYLDPLLSLFSPARLSSSIFPSWEQVTSLWENDRCFISRGPGRCTTCAARGPSLCSLLCSVRSHYPPLSSAPNVITTSG